MFSIKLIENSWDISSIKYSIQQCLDKYEIIQTFGVSKIY